MISPPLTSLTEQFEFGSRVRLSEILAPSPLSASPSPSPEPPVAFGSPPGLGSAAATLATQRSPATFRRSTPRQRRRPILSHSSGSSVSIEVAEPGSLANLTLEPPGFTGAGAGGVPLSGSPGGGGRTLTPYHSKIGLGVQDASVRQLPSLGFAYLGPSLTHASPLHHPTRAV